MLFSVSFLPSLKNALKGVEEKLLEQDGQGKQECERVRVRCFSLPNWLANAWLRLCSSAGIYPRPVSVGERMLTGKRKGAKGQGQLITATDASKEHKGRGEFFFSVCAFVT